MSRLQSLITGKDSTPQKIVFYADPGFGKSTAGSLLERPILLRTEEGRIDAPRLPVRVIYDEMLLDIKSLIEEEHDRKTLVVDCFDGVERLVSDLVCKTESVETIGDVPWAKGPAKVTERLRRFFRGLDMLASTKGMDIVLLSHVHLNKVKSPIAEAYDRFSPCALREVSEFVEAWADCVLFGQFKTIVTSEKNKRAKGIGDGSRIIYAQNRPAYMAKNRVSLDEKYEADTPQDVLEIFNLINKGN